MSAATVLQSRSTSELESLAGAYALDSDSSKLTDFERSAILAGIQSSFSSAIRHARTPFSSRLKGSDSKP